VRQRNISGYPLTVTHVVEPGDDIDHDELLAGFELIDGDQVNESGDGFGESGQSADDEEVLR
jgi:hypothetical protein